jgi:hypothetical protein
MRDELPADPILFVCVRYVKDGVSWRSLKVFVVTLGWSPDFDWFADIITFPLEFASLLVRLVLIPSSSDGLSIVVS